MMICNLTTSTTTLLMCAVSALSLASCSSNNPGERFSYATHDAADGDPGDGALLDGVVSARNGCLIVTETATGIEFLPVLPAGALDNASIEDGSHIKWGGSGFGAGETPDFASIPPVCDEAEIAGYWIVYSTQ